METKDNKKDKNLKNIINRLTTATIGTTSVGVGLGLLMWSYGTYEYAIESFSKNNYGEAGLGVAGAALFLGGSSLCAIGAYKMIEKAIKGETIEYKKMLDGLW